MANPNNLLPQEYWFDSNTTKDSGIQLIVHFVAGLVIGVVWLAVLSRFTRVNDEDVAKLRSCSHTASNNATVTPSSPSQNQQEAKAAQTQPWAGDDIPPEQLEQIRKKFRLTQEQMSIVMQQSKQQQQLQQTSPGLKPQTPSWTPHQTMNTSVYCILISTIIYFLNRDYDGIITKLFIQWFPKEAGTLGLISATG
mmetsp:Transcript_18718/g.52069  ORF Transcript_18718/g.52069 Transcript_18718/m.52069 type:complete len:195 (-) Transcript_18718:1546-2130(-)|eukprot:CAMPEP_0198129158 /NCGR_PEP_ID=MMETSP1442-20131203/51069_1 /TAXON_ID= /ORGANISM="Craspedostauros australis, Strain CCMP3328" /LENGTH=194 /DNA_ID=CAMNT_0043789493 /DNA_START=46 /DNA_END=630 /DNA_ORIENTATION=+